MVKIENAVIVVWSYQGVKFGIAYFAKSGLILALLLNEYTVMFVTIIILTHTHYLSLASRGF